ncbi:MAG: nucleotide exchange factor GrpE [Gammaproteobacteria bacterium]
MTQEETSQETAGTAANGEAQAAEALQAALDTANARADAYRNDVLRARAELDNVQKRAAREIANAHKYALERFLIDLLPVKDSLDLGHLAAAGSSDVATLREGTELTLKLLDAALEKHGVQGLDPVNEPFNPELHQAMSVQESTEVAPGTVVTVVQKGYVLNGRLVRPAMVIVAKRPSDDGGAAENGSLEA